MYLTWQVAKEMAEAPNLKLHIAGHISADEEEAKLSSQRAQAVGAALIALGALPSRLRAKGYGKSFLRSIPPCTNFPSSLATVGKLAAQWIAQ